MTEKKLEGRVAIVTGASSGMGRDAAVTMAKHGAKVVLVARSEAKLHVVRDEIAALGGDSAEYLADITKDESSKGMVDFALQKYGAVHVAFLNAGIYRQMELDEVTDEDIDTMFKSNYSSVIFGLKYLHKAMKNTAGGKGSIIINTSAVSSEINPNMAGAWLYASSKAAEKMTMEYSSIMLAKDGIRVNAVAPGVIKTSIFGETPDDQVDQFAASVSLLGRAGLPSEISNMVLFLACDDSSFATGAEFVVDGGWRVKA